MKKENFIAAQDITASETKHPSGGKSVFVESRASGTVTCPHCWTEQRTSRNFCYQCGAAFHYLDEMSQIG